MKENKKRDSSSMGRLRLVISPDLACMEKNHSGKNLNEIEPEYTKHHYSYAEFIHFYVEHINKIRRSKNCSGNSKFMKLFKAEAANS